MDDNTGLRRDEAWAIDRDEGVHDEWDEAVGTHGVFGLGTGFCYATFCDAWDASLEAERLNECAKRGTYPHDA